MVKKHDLLLVNKDSVSTLILTKDSQPIGELIVKNNLVEYSMNNVFRLRRIKALNTEAVVSSYYVQMVFRKPPGTDDLVFNNFNQLLWCKFHGSYSLKHDRDKDTRYIEETTEIFVEDMQFLEEEDQEYTKKCGMPWVSKFETEFWNDCNCELYYPANWKFLDDMKMR